MMPSSWADAPTPDPDELPPVLLTPEEAAIRSGDLRSVKIGHRRSRSTSPGSSTTPHSRRRRE